MGCIMFILMIMLVASIWLAVATSTPTFKLPKNIIKSSSESSLEPQSNLLSDCGISSETSPRPSELRGPYSEGLFYPGKARGLFLGLSG
jgi:hypothetical protein